jgi:hypothetical protein
MRALFALFAALLAATPGSAQYADQKAVEAVVRELHPAGDTVVYVSPIMAAPNVEGTVRINQGNLEALQTRFEVRVAEPAEAIDCEDVSEKSTCRVKDGGVIFQFIMPEPVKSGVLYMAVMLLKDGAGDGGQIGREWWNLALLNQPGEGWTVVDKELTETAGDPW